MSTKTSDAKTPAALRVGYLLRMYPRFSQTFVVNEIRELERQGVDVHIASLRLPNEGMFHESVTRIRAKADYLEERFVGNMRQHFSAQWKFLRRSPRDYLQALRVVRGHRGVAWFELCQAASLLRWARKEQVSHVHVHFGTDEASVAMLASMLGDLSYSLTLHAFDIFRDNVDRVLLARKINASAFTVTVCESNRRFMVEHLPGVDPAKIRVNYNGIELSEFAPPTSTTAKEREPFSVFSVGRFIEKKGFIHLVRATAMLRESGVPIVCRIAGEGREQERLEKEIRKHRLGDHVQILGPLRQDEVRSWMQRSACFALPCVEAKDGNVDALPTVLLESLACGCPSVSTRLSGIPEIMEDGESGLLVEPGTDRELADAIRRILTDTELARTLSVQGRTRAEQRFDGRTNVATMREWLTAALELGRRVPARSSAADAAIERLPTSPATTQEAA